MSGSASLSLEQAVLGHTLGYAALPPTGAVFVALCAMAPAPTEVTAGSEVSGGGYVRMPATFALVAPPGNLAANTASVQFPTATAAWGTIAFFELWDAPTGGNRLYWGTLVDPITAAPITITVIASDITRFSAGSLIVQALPPTASPTSIGAYLPLAGGTLTGTLLLPAAAPVLPLAATTKQYVDGTLGAGYVPAINPITGVAGIAAFPGDIYQSPDSYALSGSLTIRDQPYGYYDTGTLLSVVATTGPLSSSRAGVAGGFEAGVSAIAGYGSFDTVNIYSGVRSEAPPLVLHSVTYDATHVFPAAPLTTAQMQALRKNMWVLTNAIDPSVSATPAVPNGTIPERHYGSYVTNWATDGTSITVCGWTVPGSGHTGTGQVPSVTLDPGAPNATAYFGSPTNIFGGNFMAQHNPSAVPDSRTRSYQGIEFNFQNYGTADYQVAVAGLSLVYTPINGTVKATADSYGAKLSGFPTGIIVDYAGTGLHIEADTAITSNVFNANHWWSPAPWAGSPISSLTWESQNYIDSNLMRLQCWISRDAAGGGWPTASVHLGVRVDGTPLTLTGGTQLAQIAWNAQGWQGGLQLLNGAGVPALSIDVNANLHFRGDIAGVRFDTLPANAATDAAAATAGVPLGGIYRNGSTLMVRVL